MLTKQDLDSIGNLITEKLKPIEKDIGIIKRDIKKINKNMERDFGFHESHNLHVARNVQQIQKHLGMPVMTIEPPEFSNF